MTVIVAAVTGKNRVTMAADSECTSGWQKANLASPKLWVDGGYVFGCSGLHRAAQVLKHHVDWPEPSATELLDFEAFLVRRVIPAMWDGVKGHGVVEKHKGAKSLPVEFLIATGGALACIGGDGCVTSDDTGRMATGSGYAEALGSLGVRGDWKKRDVVEAAHVAAISAVGVGGPVTVADTKTLEVRRAD